MIRWALPALCAAVLVPAAVSQNWAQLSGDKSQNVAVAADSPWIARYGHAVAIILNPQPANSEPLPVNQRTRIFILGGESHVTENIPDTERFQGSGRFLNDVWRSLRVNFIAENSRVQTNTYGDPLPRLVSQMQWVPTDPLLSVPDLAAYSYQEWLCCATPAVDWGCRVILKCDPFAASRRWTPRRNHAATTVYATGGPFIVVLGGRAQAMITSPGSTWINGGVVGGVPSSFYRQPSVLMNDVWTSKDGEIWTLRNVGCFVPNEDFNQGRGTSQQQCTSDDQCIRTFQYGSATTVTCQAGRCVCKSWQQRERHTATVMNNQIFITGGVTTVTKQQCALLACGGGYTVFLNDVWMSPDVGVTWLQLQATSQWRARADHAVVSSGSMLYLMAGRGGVANDYHANPMFNDLWTSTDGVTWTLRNATAPWGPRAGAQAIYGPDVLFDDRGQATSVNMILLVGGEEVVLPSPSPSPFSAPEAARVAAQFALHEPEVTLSSSQASASGAGEEDTTLVPLLKKAALVNGEVMKQLNEVWRWTPDVLGSTWEMDYLSNGSLWERYISLTTALDSPLLGYNSSYLTPLRKIGIYTLKDLALADGDVVSGIIEGGAMPDICSMKGRVETIYARCATQPTTYDGEFMKDLVYYNGLGAINPPVVIPDPCAGLKKVPYNMTDVPCKLTPKPRSAFRSVMFETWPMIIGGYQGINDYANDVWYRDNRIPKTFVTNQPSSGTSDSVIGFTSDILVASFEYRIYRGHKLREEDLLRNWTSTLSPIDYKDWLSKGTYTFQVRAISPSGNRDPYILPRNSFTWKYVPALPWLIIILTIVLVAVAIAAGILYWKRLRRRRALEKYALKRKRRKLKAAKMGDWRNYYKKSVIDKNKIKKSKKDKKKKKKKSGNETERSRTGRSTSRSKSSRGDKSARSSSRTSRSDKSKKSKKTSRSGGAKTDRSKKSGGKSSRSKA